MVSLLVFLAGLVLSYTFVFPHLRETKIENWRDLLQALAGLGKLGITFVVGVFLAAVMDNLFSSAPPGSVWQIIGLLTALIICFYGIEIFLLSRPGVEVGEKIFVRGLYPLAIILFFKPTILHYGGLSEGDFLLGMGLYLMALSGLWLLSFWPRVQGALADVIGLIVLVALYFLKRYLDYGEMANIHEPNFWLGYWPVAFYLLPTLVLTIVFWKARDNWRRTWLHRSVVAGHLVWVTYALPYIILLGTGDLTPRLITATVRFNQAQNQLVEIKLYRLEQEGELAQVERQIALYHELVKEGKPLPSWATEKWLSAAYELEKAVEKKRLEIWKNRPRKVLRPWAMIYEKIVGARKTAPAMIEKFRKEVIGI